MKLFCFAASAKSGDRLEIETFSIVADDPIWPEWVALKLLLNKYPGHTYLIGPIVPASDEIIEAIKKQC